MVYDTDSKGRVLGETLYNSRNEVVWTLKNTWVGDRITAILKTEGEDKRLIEFDYDASGNRIAERDIRNGVLERQILVNGKKETEELYMNGVMVLRAFLEDGRKISEERVRHR
jgi:YD repeat-containing protein